MKTILETLQAIEENINACQNRIGILEKNPPNYYFIFAKHWELDHDKAIAKRCLEHWKWRWNKYAKQLPQY